MRSRGILARIVPVSRPGWGSPGQGLPGEPGEPPDWGIDEGEPPQVEPPEDGPPPRPMPSPPGIWPPLEGPSHPIYPIGPGDEHPDQGPWEPGEIWPPIRPPLGSHRPPPAAGQPLPKQLAFAAIWLQGYGWRWCVVDLNAVHFPSRPTPPAGGIVGRPPARPGGTPEPEPRR